jgi:hypothetical protein
MTIAEFVSVIPVIWGCVGYLLGGAAWRIWYAQSYGPLAYFLFPYKARHGLLGKGRPYAWMELLFWIDRFSPQYDPEQDVIRLPIWRERTALLVIMMVCWPLFVLYTMLYHIPRSVQGACHLIGWLTDRLLRWYTRSETYHTPAELRGEIARLKEAQRDANSRGNSRTQSGTPFHHPTQGTRCCHFVHVYAVPPRLLLWS